jgi:hypothetical protein
MAFFLDKNFNCVILFHLRKSKEAIMRSKTPHEEDNYTSSIIAIGAASPRRVRVLMIRV